MNELAKELLLYENDLRRIVKTARRLVGSDAPLATTVGRRHIFGGKRLRALVALMSGRLCNLPDDTSDKIAAAIEIIHTATLLHDDVVDEAPLRRRKSTANRVHGNAAAVLVGDFLYSRASQILADIGSLPLLSWISRSTNSLAEGEVLQLEQSGKLIDEDAYFDIIRRKTANLFEAAAVAGALVGSDEKCNKNLPILSEYGRHLGIAFQLIDDYLDYSGSDEEMGKKIGRDFAEGKMTLPVILVIKTMTANQRKKFIANWEKEQERGKEQHNSFADVLSLMHSSGALTEVHRRATIHATTAIDNIKQLPDSPHQKTLITLAEKSLGRQS